MKILFSITFLLCLSQYTAAFSLWPFGHAAKRAPQEPSQAEVDERSLVCKIDAVLLACKALGAVATTFCSSYLHITPTTTVAYTTKPSITTVPTTVTSTTTTTTTTTTTDIDSTTLTTLTTSYSITSELFRRTAIPAAHPVPAPLSKFLAAQISSACSCLSLKNAVSTSTRTVPTISTAFSTAYTTTTSTSTTIFTTESTSTAIATSVTTIVLTED